MPSVVEHMDTYARIHKVRTGGVGAPGVHLSWFGAGSTERTPLEWAMEGWPLRDGREVHRATVIVVRVVLVALVANLVVVHGSYHRHLVKLAHLIGLLGSDWFKTARTWLDPWVELWMSLVSLEHLQDFCSILATHRLLVASWLGHFKFFEILQIGKALSALIDFELLELLLLDHWDSNGSGITRILVWLHGLKNVVWS